MNATDPGPSRWDDERARRWVTEARHRESQLAPVLDVLFTHAALRPGEQVLDVGCGTGPTTARAAAEVTSTGRVTGADISAVMIEAARARVSGTQVDWLIADVAAHDFPPASYDVVISRFGVMFFADPAAAFGRLARATRSGGRMSLAVWQRMNRSPFFHVPYATTLAVLDRLGVDYVRPDLDTGPFGLSDLHRIEALLTECGWTDVSFTPDDRPLYLGGPGDVDHATTTAMGHGPVHALLESQPADVNDQVRTALRQVVVAGHDGTGFPLAAGMVIIDARRP